MLNLTASLFSKEDSAGCCFFVFVCTQVCICAISVKAHMHKCGFVCMWDKKASARVSNVWISTLFICYSVDVRSRLHVCR